MATQQGPQSTNNRLISQLDTLDFSYGIPIADRRQWSEFTDYVQLLSGVAAISTTSASAAAPVTSERARRASTLKPLQAFLAPPRISPPKWLIDVVNSKYEKLSGMTYDVERQAVLKDGRIVLPSFAARYFAIMAIATSRARSREAARPPLQLGNCLMATSLLVVLTAGSLAAFLNPL